MDYCFIGRKMTKFRIMTFDVSRATFSAWHATESKK